MIEDDGNKTDKNEIGKPMETMDAKDDLTNRQGHPIYDNQSSRTVGNRGPVTLKNYPFLEKITHFDRENNFKQAGERYRTIEQWERDDLVFNMSDMLLQCNEDIQNRMIGLLRQCDEEYGQRVADGIKKMQAEKSAAQTM